MYEINHEEGTISMHCVDVTHHETDSFGLDSLSNRLSSALTTTRIKTDDVEFWREKAENAIVPALLFSLQKCKVPPHTINWGSRPGLIYCRFTILSKDFL